MVEKVLMRRYLPKLAILVFGVLVITACAPLWPKNALPYLGPAPAVPGMASVYIYRPHVADNYRVQPLVYINDRKIAALKDQGYTVVHLPPGNYTIKAEWSLFDSVRGLLAITGTGRYYVKFDHAYHTEPYFEYHNGVVTTRTVQRAVYRRWLGVPESEALQEIRACYLIEDLPS